MAHILPTFGFLDPEDRPKHRFGFSASGFGAQGLNPRP